VLAIPHLAHLPPPAAIVASATMTAAWSKRQQARNERALQELIKNVPGNDVCADCGARNPGTSAPSTAPTEATEPLTRWG
jgi:hypothetical protein